jgi:WS/DGAT/MGAT family acyltransferase
MPDVERMSRVDTAWLRMDNDVNLMMIVGVWLLTPALSMSALRKRVADRLLRYERFHQKAVVDATGAHWAQDDRFDIRAHVVAAALKPAAGESQRRALQRLCGELAAQPLNPSRPLWQFHLVDSYEGGSALVARIHHCIGDGMALTSVMMSITDGGADRPRGAPRAPPEEAHEHDSLTDALLRPLSQFAVKAATAIMTYRAGRDGNGRSGMPGRPATPQPSPPGSADRPRGGLQVVNDLAALALMPDDSPTLLKGPLSGSKAVAWSEPLSLHDVKTIGRGLGCTVNDVLLSCAAGAIGGYLRARGQDPAGKEIRAMVPVNLRALDEAWQLGNHFGLTPLVLPIGVANPVQRLLAVRRRMDELKGSYQPLLAFAVLSLSGLLNKALQDSVLGLFAKKATAVMTNVPGPAVPLKFCGSTLRQHMFWVPASGNIGVGVSILSYGGGVQFGLITDQQLCPEPQQIIDRFEPEFDKLLWLALMLPWPGQTVD